MDQLVKNQHSGRSSKSLIIGLCVLALTVGTAGSALALTLDFSSVAGAAIAFDGTGNFTFPNTGAYDFDVPNSSGLHGNLDGTFTVESITSFTIGGIIYQTATITGLGTLSFFDGTNTLAATLTWPDINSLEYNTAYSTGTLNFGTTPNLYVTDYTGSNSDLQFLIGNSPATITLTFTFLGQDAGKSLSELIAHPVAAGYAGNISAAFTVFTVPVPSTLLLLGSGLVGLLGLSRRSRKTR